MPTPTADTYTAASGATLQGGRGTPPSGLPTWVPTTAWQWTDIPSSRYSDYMKSDGTGIAPDTRSSTGDAGPDWSYQAQWAYSGPTYSRLNHEVWLFGGGHAATTNNIIVKWRLNRASPDMAVACQPTSIAIRNAYLQAETWRTTAYLADGKPCSPHSYYNNLYSDATDEFISFGIAGTATGYPTASGVTAGSADVAALQRSGVWRAENHYSDVVAPQSLSRGPRLMSDDGTTVYYWDGPPQSTTTDLRKFVLATNTHSVVGSSGIGFYSCIADAGAGVALSMGGASSSGSSWQAKFVTLATGATVDVTVSGDVLPAGMGCVDIAWCGARGYYVAVWANNSAVLGGGGAVTTVVVATITPTGSNTATASVKTMTGTAMTAVPFFRGAFYDPLFDAVVVVPGYSHPLKIFKVA